MKSNWGYSQETPNSSQNRCFFVPYDLEIWQMTNKNNRAPLIRNMKLCASFHHHIWNEIGVRVRKRLSLILTFVTFTFDPWPWPFAWSSPVSLVITPENFVMMRWWEHSENGVIDGRTDGWKDGRTEPFIGLLGRSLKSPDQALKTIYYRK